MAILDGISACGDIFAEIYYRTSNLFEFTITLSDTEAKALNVLSHTIRYLVVDVYETGNIAAAAIEYNDDSRVDIDKSFYSYINRNILIPLNCIAIAAAVGSPINIIENFIRDVSVKQERNVIRFVHCGRYLSAVDAYEGTAIKLFACGKLIIQTFFVLRTNSTEEWQICRDEIGDDQSLLEFAQDLCESCRESNYMDDDDKHTYNAAKTITAYQEGLAFIKERTMNPRTPDFVLSVFGQQYAHRGIHKEMEHIRNELRKKIQ